MSQIKELSANSKQIFDKINNNDLVGLKASLGNGQKADIFDENGMTPLQHAAYKGNKDIVQFLLDQGADVNSSKHEHGYTALHFGALSGNVDVCNLLLLAGAKSQVTNSVGRNAAQMAAFVGNHGCVAVINNFIPKSDIDYYTIPQGLQKEPVLKPILADPVHKFITQINVNPVRITINLQRSITLNTHLKDLKKVLELMTNREMKRGMETNEIMAFKFHYLGCIVDEILKSVERQISNKNDDGDVKITSTDDEKKETDCFELFIRKLLKTNKEGNYAYMDGLLKECVREFPFRECTIFRQMVSTLAGQDPPSALSVITAAINGQKGFASDIPLCNTCGEEKPAKKCSKCKAVQYCDRECQRLHWFMHKKACNRLSQPSPKNSSAVLPDAATLTSHVQNLVINN